MKITSIYAMNKADKDAIVYTDAYGNIIRLTKEDFGSEEEFRKWKDFSDEDYHTQEKADHIERNHTVSIEEISQSCYATESAEEAYFNEIERREKEKAVQELLQGVRENITETQFRRLEKHYGENMTLDEIERDEHVDHQRVSKSIIAGKARAKKYLKKISLNESKQGAKKA